MTTDPKTPTPPHWARALVAVEWIFLKAALATLVGVLPFALASVNTSGRILAAGWGVVYVIAVGATMRVYVGLIWDAVRVACHREPTFRPAFDGSYEENKTKIEQARAVLPRPILWLLAFLPFMNPLALTGILASLYVVAKHPARGTPPAKDARLGRAELMAYYETRQATPPLSLAI